MTDEIETTDSTMRDSARELGEALIGHKIVSATKEPRQRFEITLDTGDVVVLADTNDCCAYTELENFLLNVESIDNVITSVSTDEDYHRWFIYADKVPVLELGVEWSEGSGYYGYGFYLDVRPAE